MNQTILTTASKAILLIAFTSCALVLSVGASAYGDEFDRIDNMAKKIQKKSKLLIKETAHYRHTAQYGSLVDATNHLYDAASHVHHVVHFANNLNHLQADLAELDQYFHQLEGLFAAAEDSASRGHGQVYGNTAYARGLLRSIEVSIDLMRKDVRKLQNRSLSAHHQVYRAATPAVLSTARHDYARGHTHNQSVAPVRVAPAKPIHVSGVKPQRSLYQPPGCRQSRQSNGFSFSIGGGSSRIQFNF